MLSMFGMGDMQWQWRKIGRHKRILEKEKDRGLIAAINDDLPTIDRMYDEKCKDRQRVTSFCIRDNVIGWFCFEGTVRVTCKKRSKPSVGEKLIIIRG